MDRRERQLARLRRLKIRSDGRARGEHTLHAGGRVTGVEPQFFIDAELQYDAIDELIVTETMAERRTKMIELGDAFIAMPGGTGTLEEISEVMSMGALGHLDAPLHSVQSEWLL